MAQDYPAVCRLVRFQHLRSLFLYVASILSLYCSLPNLACSAVQYAGNKNPFLVTVILSCVQLLSMIMTATMTDSFGRRPLTVYPYAVTVVSVLCLGIIGCFDYTTKALGSLLVSPRSLPCSNSQNSLLTN